MLRGRITRQNHLQWCGCWHSSSGEGRGDLREQSLQEGAGWHAPWLACPGTHQSAGQPAPSHLWGKQYVKHVISLSLVIAEYQSWLVEGQSEQFWVKWCSVNLFIKTCHICNLAKVKKYFCFSWLCASYLKVPAFLFGFCLETLKKLKNLEIHVSEKNIGKKGGPGDRPNLRKEMIRNKLFFSWPYNVFVCVGFECRVSVRSNQKSTADDTAKVWCGPMHCAAVSSCQVSDQSNSVVIVKVTNNDLFEVWNRY